MLSMVDFFFTYYYSFIYLLDISLVIEPSSYEESFKSSWLYKELHKTRNIRPSFNTRFGLYGGLLYTGTIWYLSQGNEPWTLQHHHKNGLLSFLFLLFLLGYY